MEQHKITLSKAVQSRWFWVPVALFPVALCVPFYLSDYGHHVPVGLYIAIMGLLAAAVTLRDQPSVWEKAMWILVLTCMMGAEIRNLYVADAEQAATFKTISDSLATTSKGLKDTAAGLSATSQGIHITAAKIDTAISNSQTQFNATMGRTESVLEGITGGSSYPVIMPMLPHINSDGSVPIAALNRGDKDPLTGVTATVYSAGLWMANTQNSIMNSVNQRINIGTLHHGERIVLSSSIQPKAFQETGEMGRQPTFRRSSIYISAQNYSFQEYLDFKEDGKGAWLYRYMLYRTGPEIDKSGRAIGSGMADTLLESADWSSDCNYPNITAHKTWH